MWNIYFIRHGQTDRNLNKQMNPWDIDSELNAKWIEQAKNVWKEIFKAGIQFDIIISSPLKRALNTAEMISKEIWYTKKIKTDKRLKEQLAWELKDYTHEKLKNEFKTTNNEEIRRIFKDIKYNKIEDIKDFYSRVTDFYGEIKNTDKNILIISHTWVSRILLINSEWLDFEYAIYKMDSTPNWKLIKL